MKWLIASDLHGSAYYAKELVRIFEEEHADRILFLGDLLYHGPRNDLPRDYAPKEIISLLSPLADCFLCVRGNCDAEVDQMVLPFPILSDYALLPIENRLLYLTHGHLFSNPDVLPLKRGDILLSGHTHIPLCSVGEKIIRLNPGSLSIPKEQSPSSYMTLENQIFLWKTINGSVYHTLDLSKDAGTTAPLSYINTNGKDTTHA